MGGLLAVLDHIMMVVVPAVVWTLLGVGVFELVREIVPETDVIVRRAARGMRS